MYKHELLGKYINKINPESVFVEIGSDRHEGSTLYLADLAEQHSVALHTVDIDPNAKYHKTPEGFRTLKECWQNFYAGIKDSNWPDVESINELPDNLKQECLNFGWTDTEKSFVPPLGQHVSKYTLENHPGIVWHTCIGSEWAKEYNNKINKPISLLYLDNFDYVWSTTNMDDSTKTLVDIYKIKYNTTMNNQNCQLEHFAQASFLINSLDTRAIVAFDDTYLLNDCWVGKCGPAVILFLNNGYKIIEYDKTQSFVIMGT